jgi:hypothetical protein
MAIDTIAGLKAKMPIGAAAGTSVADLHDLIDTLEDRTTQVLVTVTGDYGVALTDNRRKIVVNAAVTRTVTLPASTPAGFELVVIQLGTGAAAIAATGGTLLSKDNHTRTSGQNAVAYLFCISNAGSSPQIILTGDTAP